MTTNELIARLRDAARTSIELDAADRLAVILRVFNGYALVHSDPKARARMFTALHRAITGESE